MLQCRKWPAFVVFARRSPRLHLAFGYFLGGCSTDPSSMLSPNQKTVELHADMGNVSHFYIFFPIFLAHRGACTCVLIISSAPRQAWWPKILLIFRTWGLVVFVALAAVCWCYLIVDVAWDQRSGHGGGFRINSLVLQLRQQLLGSVVDKDV